MKQSSLFKRAIPTFALASAVTFNLQAVTLEQAKLIAKQQMAHAVTAKPSDTFNTITQIKTLTGEQGEPLIYLLQVNNKGFVFVSAVNIDDPVLAYGTQGAEDLDKINNPGLNQWVNRFKQELEQLDGNILRNKERVNTAKNFLTRNATETLSTPIAPLTTTQWSQNGYYNDQTPDEKLVGCVGTAISQFLRYHMYPWYGQGGAHSYAYPQYDQDEITVHIGNSYYYWPWMPDVVTNETSERHRWEVSQIMYHAGATVNALYGHDVTLAPLRYIPRALEKHFGYVTNGFEYRSDVTHDEWHSMAQEELAANRPFILTGLDSDLGIGHAWIVDGYDGDKYHMNWGWGGSMNGYFSIDSPTVRTYIFDQRMAMVRAAPERDLQHIPFCEGTEVYRKANDSFSDGSQSWNYRINANCKILIQPEGASNITLSFSEFKTESGYDFVTLYDGDTSNANQLGRYSGSSLPASITSTQGSMLIHFTSDDIVTEDGWSASYTSQ